MNKIEVCYNTNFLNLYHCDCIDLMAQYPDKYFDLALVDPPYGIDAGNMSMGYGKNKKYKKSDWDKKTPDKSYFTELFRISKNQIICGGNYFADKLPISKCWIFWDKGINGDSSFADGELIWTSFNSVLRVAPIRYKGFLGADKERIHITQKPINLYDWILKKYSAPNQKILDTHFGSGSIALAVDKANRLDKMNLHLTACEIDKEYIDKAIKRISESIKQGTLSF